MDSTAPARLLSSVSLRRDNCSTVHNLPASSHRAADPWFAVNTLPHAERRAKENLERQGWKCFLPILHQTKRVGRRLIDRRLPLFSGYLFVSFDPDHSQWRSIDSTYGVRRLLKASDRPLRIAPGVVETLEQMRNDDGEIQFSANIRPGTRVQFIHGPFAQLVGTLEHLDQHGRVRVLLNLLGRESSIKTTTKDIIPLKVT